jgi:hypothetical protein
MATMPVCHTQFEGELSLSEILADPIIQLVMARDGIFKDEVERLIGAVHDKLATRQESSQIKLRQKDRQTSANASMNQTQA